MTSGTKGKSAVSSVMRGASLADAWVRAVRQLDPLIILPLAIQFLVAQAERLDAILVGLEVRLVFPLREAVNGMDGVNRRLAQAVPRDCLGVAVLLKDRDLGHVLMSRRLGARRW